MGNRTPEPDVAPVPDGHRRVRWIYNPDRDKVGEVVDMPAGEAHELVLDNRVAYVPAGTALGKPEPEPEPEPGGAGGDTKAGPVVAKGGGGGSQKPDDPGDAVAVTVAS